MSGLASGRVDGSKPVHPASCITLLGHEPDLGEVITFAGEAGEAVEELRSEPELILQDQLRIEDSLKILTEMEQSRSIAASSGLEEAEKQAGLLGAALESERKKSLALGEAEHSASRVKERETLQSELSRALTEPETKLSDALVQGIGIHEDLSRERERSAGLTRRFEAANERIAEARQTCGDLPKLLSEAEAKHAERASYAAAIEDELTRVRQNLADATGRADGLSARLVASEAAAAAEAKTAAWTAKNQIADIQALLSREHHRNAELSDAAAAAENELASERERLAGLTSRLTHADAALARERSQSESQLAALAATGLKLAGELTRARQAESELHVSRHECQALKRASQEAQILIADLRRNVATQAATNAGILASLRGDLVTEQRRSAAIADAQREADARKSAALEEALRRQEAAGAAAADALLRSTSWKLTAPWRAYKRIMSRLRRLARGRKSNPLFDREWYLRQYPDVRESELDPYAHYLRHGAAEGRDPNPLFDTDWYLAQNPDVRQSGANPLVHFYLHGAAEGRDPHPSFSNDWYFQQHPLLQKQGTNALVHYLALLKQE